MLKQSNSQDWMIVNVDTFEQLRFTSFIDLDVRNDGQALTYPVEEGGFASYNKVESPLELRVTLGYQGDEVDFEYVLDMLNEIKKGATLLDVFTPHAIYEDMTLESYSFNRKQSENARKMTVELSLIEVRQVETQVTTVISRPKNPTSANKENEGQKQGGSILAGY